MLNFLKSISAKRPAPDGKPPVSVRERVSALRHLPAFLKLIWRTSPGLALANIALRLLRAGLPLATLYVGKLIIDAVVTLTKQPAPERVLTSVLTLVALEFGLVLLADALGRGVALLDSLLGDLFANQSSIRLMAHAAELDLDQFEDSTFYDKLERARRQTLSRTVLMSQVLAQGQDAVTLITENPYRLARDIRGIGFRTADQVASRLGIEKEAMIRVRAGLSFGLAEATGQGHCGLPVAELPAAPPS